MDIAAHWSDRQGFNTNTSAAEATDAAEETQVVSFVVVYLWIYLCVQQCVFCVFCWLEGK